MIITTIQELRLCFPTHAIDHIEAYLGFIDNSEHEFLLNPLGQPLYDKLCEWYAENAETYSHVDGKDIGYYNRLLIMAQRCVAFDAMSRSIDQQSVSMNNAGINMSMADDYKPADGDAVGRAKNSYIKEAHSSLNRLLYTLEQWIAICPAAEDVETETEELFEICKFWRSSRYFYLSAQLLIPSAVVLQEYLNIYDSREKFIQMLPDLHFIQEEQIAPAIGEDFCDELVTLQLRGGTRRDLTAATAAQPKTAEGDTLPATTRRLLHKLRKIEATLLEGRTKVIKVEKDRRIAARDEGIRLLGQWREYCQQHQSAILRDLDTIAGQPATAAALLSPEDQEALDPAVLNACLEAEQPFTDSPMFLAPVWESGESEGQVLDSSQRNQATCPHDSIDGMLVTPPLL